MTADQLDIFAALDLEELADADTAADAAWEAERRRMPTRAEMLADALRHALPWPSPILADDLAAALADANATKGATGPGCTSMEADRRGIFYTTHTAPYPRDLDHVAGATDEQAAQLAAWHESLIEVARFSWQELADRLAPSPEHVEAARLLAEARRQMLDLEFSQPSHKPTTELQRIAAADRNRLDYVASRRLAAAIVAAADHAETPGGML